MLALLSTPANNIPYLFAAFALAWVIFFGLLYLTARRHVEIENEIRILKDETGRGQANDAK